MPLVVWQLPLNIYIFERPLSTSSNYFKLING